ncbi:MAG: lysylphosphatidylglycerol synthase domain-containing protein [Pyrinomonadaceae bacterium]
MTLNQLEHTKNSRLKILGLALTILGLGLFGYFIYEAGIEEIWDGINRLGFGFLLIVVLYAFKLATRAGAWKLSLEKPYSLGFFNAYRAVIMGEALTAIIPLGILTSGTTKAVAVRKQLPLVVGLSSVAIENLFYSLATAVLFLSGGMMFLFLFHPTGNAALASYALIALVFAAIIGGFLMVIYEWRFASNFANWLYNRNLATRLLHSGRAQVLHFENLIYGFYRHQPQRFLPILLLETAFHTLGILEVWIILDAISDVRISFGTALLLDSVNHIILFTFKLIPFALGVDEAGARYITDTLAIGAGVGVTLAIIRKGRVLFWTILGMLLVARSGLSWKEVTSAVNETQEAKA